METTEFRFGIHLCVNTLIIFDLEPSISRKSPDEASGPRRGPVFLLPQILQFPSSLWTRDRRRGGVER